ncbi:SDR family oxidoreductase [Pseudomonadales bacterium]|nr:SDR family oxidoreductase [Pseudomonadales bacterium]MDB2542677.1 SDR family oxidoreductase [Pseudomonadales bacterium]MDG1002525.1 SDR family NAD(P)-dependent oxidoreductase [Pseudomonadales bacterium]MDG1304437.1 SDR family NAD(P)-dependent oxidoreductase [Pseudomonadales bacterium]MDG1836117.1 SDR family NAD(P)-dependent oxidoreductase [Pseudomonadales bacterium]
MKTLIITGASKGIGFQVAKMAAEKSYRVINISRSDAAHASIENHNIDLAAPDAADKFALLVEELQIDGHITLIHNAAELKSDSAANTATADFRHTLELNVVAPHILNQILIPKMTQGSGIIYVGSTLSEKAVANTYSYVVSKHALIGMMRSTCQDLANTGIHTACVCPGFTDTEMLRAHVGEDAEIIESLSSLSTFGRLVTPEEIANTIVFAAENPVINGAVIHANLGQVER